MRPPSRMMLFVVILVVSVVRRAWSGSALRRAAPGMATWFASTVGCEPWKMTAGRRADLAARHSPSLMWSAPFVWMVSTSFKLPGDVMTLDIEWFPHRAMTLDNYVKIFSSIRCCAGAEQRDSAASHRALRAVRRDGGLCVGAHAVSRAATALFTIFLASLMIPTEVSSCRCCSASSSSAGPPATRR